MIPGFSKTTTPRKGNSSHSMKSSLWCQTTNRPDDHPLESIGVDLGYRWSEGVSKRDV
jgi:hypothetical protein